MAEQIKLEGLKELKNTLKKLPKDIRKKALTQGLRKGARIILIEARANVPADSGLARRSIAIRQEKNRYLENAARLRIGVLQRKGKSAKLNPSPYYWRFLEFGTSKMKARPFLVPAFERMKYAALKAITDHYKKAIPKLARKRGR